MAVLSPPQSGCDPPPINPALPPTEPEPVQAQQSKTGKYVPPSLRDGASRRGESMQPNRRADDNATIRVTNLSEDTRETDLQELFRPFGSISRIYLAKDKTTGQSKVGQSPLIF
ncbi:eukaryotic translation initiation factor 3 subunit G, partial [Phasianus colchicus]|uniref:eukaryotic translation initiation factor 3 subunit G n=1 Tax=Phasianus colchicus TaxID=9054 RepID=UPI00129EA836